MPRPACTASRREALLVYRNAEGMLEIGKGRIRIAPGTVPYFRRVVADLGQVLDAPGGVEAFERGDALGHGVTIRQPEIAARPPNGWTLPEDIVAATAAGIATGLVDANGSRLVGTGAGCGSTIVYDPDDWALRHDPFSPPSHEVLLQLLLHANACAAGTVKPPEPTTTDSAHQLLLDCRPAKIGDVLSFPYIIKNPGPDAVYVMVAVARADPATRAACASERHVVLIGPTGDAIVGGFIPPMPADRQIAVPVIALARRLAVGEAYQHRLDIPVPYAETSPWLPDLPPQQYVQAEIKGVVLAIAYWPAATAGLCPIEVGYAPGLYAVAPPGAGPVVSLRFPTTGLRFARRVDAVARSPG